MALLYYNVFLDLGLDVKAGEIIMSYLFLTIALLSGATKGYFGKKTSGLITNTHDSVYISTIRFIICVVISLVICLFDGGLSLAPSGLLICGLSGISQALFVCMWLLAVHSGAYMMVEVFLTVGIIIPTVLCNIFFKESISVYQWCGFAVLIAAAYIMCTYNNSIKSKISVKSYLVLLICGIANGFVDFAQKLFVKTQTEYTISVFNLYTYTFAALLLALIFIFEKGFFKKTLSTNCNIKSFGIYVFAMAVCLFLYSYFKTLAGKSIPAIIMYPVCQGVSMILSALMANFIFKERINKQGIMGMLLAFISLMIITLSGLFV